MSPTTRRPIQRESFGSSRPHTNDFADKFVTGRSGKVVITAQDFQIGVADAGEAHADERPAWPQRWQQLLRRYQSSLANRKGKHSCWYGSGGRVPLGPAQNPAQKFICCFLW